MIRLKKIVIATDLSHLSLPAVQHGCELAEQFGADVHLLHVVCHPFAGFAEQSLQNLEASFDDYEREQCELADEELARIDTAPLKDPERVVRVTRPGPAAVEIPQYTEEADADLLILGTHGRTGLDHVLMGSVCEAVVRRARCPVMTVRAS